MEVTPQVMSSACQESRNQLAVGEIKAVGLLPDFGAPSGEN
jgi:hypothetical protein